MSAAEMDVAPAAEPAEPEVPREPHHLDILECIKTSQNQNGLRHSDYQRYRQYCGRRLRRMRVAVKFTHGRKEFKGRTMDAETASDVRHLMLLLVNAERAWSYAMHLKQRSASDADASSRYRVHSMRRLRKAAQWSQQLLELCEATADTKTKLEAEAYAAWMHGNVSLESEAWAAAKKSFTQTNTIYSQLAQLEYSELYAARTDEIEPSIRYCDYNLQRFGGGGGEDGGAADTAALLEMKLSNDALLKSKLASAMQENRKLKASESATSSGVRWRGQSVPVDNAKVSAKVLEAREHDMELSQAAPDDDARKEEVYTALLTCLDEALHAVNADKAKKGVGGDAVVESLAEYLEFTKLRYTIQRHSLLVASREAALAAADAGQPTDGKVSPKELASLYHQMANYAASMLAVPGVGEQEDHDVAFLAAQQRHYQAARCHFSARTFMERGLWPQAYVCFERAVTVCDESKAAYGKAGHSAEATAALATLDRISTASDGLMSAVRAKGFYAANAAELSLSDDLAELTLSNQDILVNGQVVDLMDRLGKMVPENARLSDPAVSRLTSFPPRFKELSCRPLLFDVAADGIQFPSLDEHKGRSGLLGRLFGR